MSWTDERVELLKKMWGEGQSASQIAKELGGVTRNAVIGKVHRLGLSNRVAAGGAVESPAPDPMSATAKPAAPTPPPAPAAEPTPDPAPVAQQRTAEVVQLADKAAAAPRAAAAEAPSALSGETPGTRSDAADADTESDAGPDTGADEVEQGPSAPGSYARRAIIPAGQPLPPQPSANEVSPEALATVREIEKKARRLTLLELTERTCKWPVGDPATEDFWFCGLPTQPGKPYCEAHVSVAFQPMSSRRDRRR